MRKKIRPQQTSTLALSVPNGYGHGICFGIRNRAYVLDTEIALGMERMLC